MCIFLHNIYVITYILEKPQKPLFSVLWKIFHSKAQSTNYMFMYLDLYAQGQYDSENEQTQNEIYILFM